jgi:hypothetical protein
MIFDLTVANLWPMRKPALPLELLQTIFEEVHNSNKEDLLNIRLANRYFCSIVTSYAFRTMHVEASTKAFRSIMVSPHLAREVKEICIVQGKTSNELVC